MGDNYKEKALSHTVVEKYNNKPSEMTNFVVSTEKCTNMPIDPVILITGLYPSKKKSWMYKDADCSIVHNSEKIETTCIAINKENGSIDYVVSYHGKAMQPVK